MTDCERLKNLRVPVGRVDCVLDTDAYNEIDDQYAISLLVKHEKTNLRALYACPFSNALSSGPEGCWDPDMNNDFLFTYDDIIDHTICPPDQAEPYNWVLGGYAHCH